MKGLRQALCILSRLLLTGGNAIVFAIDSQTTSGAFIIDSSSGAITVSSSATLDHETNTNEVLSIRYVSLNNSMVCCAVAAPFANFYRRLVRVLHILHRFIGSDMSGHLVYFFMKPSL